VNYQITFAIRGGAISQYVPLWYIQH